MIEKTIIYQLFVRVFGNKKPHKRSGGSLAENGCGTFADINTAALDSLKSLGITHIWLTGVMRHASTTSWQSEHISAAHPQVVKGRAGSPYAISDCFDVCPDLAHHHVSTRIQAFDSLIIRCRKLDFKVIIDLVPNHVARQYDPVSSEGKKHLFGLNDDTTKAFDPQNDFYYLPDQHFILPNGLDEQLLNYPNYQENPAKATGNDCFSCSPSINDWYETVKLNYGVDYANLPNLQSHFGPPEPSSWAKMLAVCLFWASKGVNGFRCDMVELTPPAFWHWLIQKVHAQYPEFIFIAEVYNPNLYNSYKNTGFELLYDKTGLYDIVYKLTKGTPAALELDALAHAQSALGHGQAMLTFMENHDEQRVASAQFGGSPEAAWPGMVLSCTFSKSAILIYNGQETGEQGDKHAGFSGDDGKTSIFDYVNMPNHQFWMGNNTFDLADLPIRLQSVRQFYSRLLHVSKHAECLISGSFYSLQTANNNNSWDYDPNRTYAFLRFTSNQKWLIVCHFEQNKPKDLHIKIPTDAFEQMQIRPNSQIVFKPVFSSDSQKKWPELLYDQHQLNNINDVKSGLVISSLPMQGYIFDISTL